MGVVHSFVLGHEITNQVHDNLNVMLQQMMSMWFAHYSRHSTDNDEQTHHIPNMADNQGFWDIVMIGNVLECAQVLDIRSYSSLGVLAHELVEMAVARGRYRRLSVIFEGQYSVTVGSIKTNPFSVFRRSLVEFAAALIVYKKEHDRSHDICSAKDVEDKMMIFFKKNYPELLPCLLEIISKKSGSFSWTGPPIEIQPIRQTRQTVSQQEDEHIRLDFVDLTIYPISERGAPSPPAANNSTLELGDRESEDEGEDEDDGEGGDEVDGEGGDEVDDEDDGDGDVMMSHSTKRRRQPGGPVAQTSLPSDLTIAAAPMGSVPKKARRH